MSSEMLLGEIAEIVMGQSPSGETCNNAGNGIPLLNGPTEFGPKHPVPVQYTTDAKRLGKEGDLLFCVRGSTTGKMNWANQTYAIGRGLAAIRGKNNYPNSYIRAAIELELNSLLNQATGSTFPNVSKDQLNAISLTKTSPEAATDIALIIEPIDDRITLLRETNATLEAIAQALFKSWFVDFDPVRAKAEGREPEGMPAEIADLFPSEFEESELGDIPKGWEIRKADLLLTRLNAKIKFTKEQVFSSGKTPVFEQGAGLLLGFHDDEAQLQASPDEPMFIFGDHTCITHLSCEPFDISANVIPLKGKDRSSLWTYYAIKNKQTFQEYRRHWSELAVKEVVVAPNNLCKVFSEFALPLYLKMEINSKEVNSLSHIRDTLLPRLMSGKLRIPDLEEQAA